MTDMQTLDTLMPLPPNGDNKIMYMPSPAFADPSGDDIFFRVVLAARLALMTLCHTPAQACSQTYGEISTGTGRCVVRRARAIGRGGAGTTYRSTG